MSSPFPGMDPYLETSDYWRNVHNNLATEIQSQLAPLLRPRYYADQEPRFIYETGLTISSRHQALPDVTVLESRLPPSPALTPSTSLLTASPTEVVIPPAPLELLISHDDPEKLQRVVIRTVQGDELVLAIEILSAVNKRPGHAAYKAYHRK